MTKTGQSTTDALAQSERRFRALTEKASELLAIVDAAGKVTYESPNQVRVLGYAIGELLGRGVFELLHPDDLAKTLTAFQECVGQPGATRQVEARVQTKQGAWRWLDIVGTNLLSDPDIQGVVLNCRDITEQKEAEAARAAGERRFRALVERSPGGITILDATGQVIYDAATAETRLGFLPEEMLGKSIFDFAHPEDHAKAEAAFRQLLETPDKPVTLELRVPTRKGADRVLHVTGTNQLHDPAIRGIVVNSFDITERKHAEEALRDSEAKYRDLIETTNTGYVILDRDGCVLDANAEYVRLTGYERLEEIRGRKVTEWTAPHDLERNAEAVRICLAEGLVRNLELDYVNREGRTTPVEINATVLSTGKTANIMSVVRDITKRKQVEDALRASEERYRLLADNVDDIVMLNDTKGGRLYVSPSYFRRTGWTMEELQSTDWRALIHPDDLALVEKTRAENLAGKRTVIEVRIHCCDGTWMWAETHCRPLFDSEGNVHQLLVWIHDITTRKLAEQALEQFKFIVEEGDEEAYLVNPDGSFAYVNKAAAEVLGYTVGEMMALGVPGIDSNYPAAAYPIAFAKIKSGELSLVETWHRAKDGRRVNKEIRTSVHSFGGHEYAVAFGRDVTARKQAEKAIQYRLALEQLVAGASNRLANVSAAELDTVTNDVLASVGQLLEADRCYLFRVSDDLATADNTHEWCAAGVPPQIADLRNVSTATFPWLRRQVLKGKPVYIRSAANLPPQATATRRLLEAGRIQSVIIVPIHQAGKLTGLVGCDAVTAERRWPDEDVRLLRTVGEILAVAQARCRAEQVVRESEDRYRRLVENLKGRHFIYRHDTLGKFTYVSESVIAVLGFPPAEFMASYDKYLTDHPVNEQVKAHTAQSIQGIQQPPYEVNSWHKDGTDRWLEVQEVPIFGPSGEVIGVEGVAQDITDRRKAEAALRESEERFRHWLNAIPYYAWYAKPDGRVITCNRRWYEYTGQQPGEPMEDGWSKAVHPDDLDRVMKKVAHDVAIGERYECEYRLRRASDGAYRCQLARGLPVKDKDGKILCWFGAGVDIEDQKQMEQALRESEERYRTLAEAAREMIFIIGADDTVQYVNSFAVQHLGLTPSQVIGQPRSRFFRGPNGERQRKHLQQVLATGQPMYMEDESVFPGGTLWLGTSLVPIGDNSGAVRAVLGVSRDITERKKMEEVLRESEERFRTLTETVSEHIWIVDAKGRPEYANRQRLEYTGLTLEQAQAANGWWSVVHPDDHLCLRETQRQAFTQGQSLQWEYRLRCVATGHYRWFLGHVVPIKNAQGQVLKWFCTATDIDEQKRLEELLEQRVEQRTVQLREEIIQRQRLEHEILNVSEREQRRIGQDLHDSVGQRLTGTKFLSSSLRRRLARASSPAAPTAGRISRELDKAIEEVRAISHGLHPVQPEGESLMLALRELAANTRKIFNVPTRLKCPRPVLVHDHAAATHLYRIAQEAVSNAARHAKPKQIVISLGEDDGRIRLRVRDDGRSLPPPSRRRAGMGLEIMKYRASVIGAAFSIRRAKTGGTIVSCLWTPPPQGADHAS